MAASFENSPNNKANNRTTRKKVTLHNEHILQMQRDQSHKQQPCAQQYKLKSFACLHGGTNALH